MKKRFIVVTVVQAIVILWLTMFSFVQKAQAGKQRTLAEMNARKAQEQMMISDHLRTQMQSEIDNLRAEVARQQNK